jgi:hypothetical protein
MNKIADDAAVWKGIFEKAVAAGETCVSENRNGRKMFTWDGEPGLLECFANPSPRILEKVGYKHAAGCLLSKTCFHCGKMAGDANPLTMTRICCACTEVQESSWVITKSKAKKAFLLTDKDCKSLLGASFPVGFFDNRNGRTTTVLFLLSDVVALITKRKAKAPRIRYATRQSSSKPQKKRRKTESLSSRPGDNLVSLRDKYPTLPIPVSLLSLFPYDGLKMTHCTECSACDVCGTPWDISRHELLEHGLTGFLTAEERVQSPREGSRIMPETIEAAEELVQLLEFADVKYYEFENTGWRIGRDLYNGNYTAALFTLGDCKVSVEHQGCRGETGTDFLWILFRTGQNMLPVELCRFGFKNFIFVGFEAEELFFDKLKEAMNLRQTTSSQLLAALIWRGMPALDSMARHGWVLDEEKAPVVSHAWKLLMNRNRLFSAMPGSFSYLLRSMGACPTS